MQRVPAPSTVCVLIIEDEEQIRDLLQAALEDVGFEVVVASNGLEGMQAFEASPPDIVLLDGVMPVMDGFETCERIRATAHGATLPVLMVTALEDDASVNRAFAAGASDFILKPLHLGVLEHRVLRMVAAHRGEIQIRQSEAMSRALAEELRQAKDDLEARVFQRTEELRHLNERLLTELSERQRIQDQLAHDVLHDALTSLTNRTLFLNRLEHVLNRAQRRDERLCAALFLDLDRFKTINDSLGHIIGDHLLVEVARRLQRSLRPGDTVSRFGGDEFAILLDSVDDLQDVVHIADRIQAELSTPFLLEGHSVATSASIGIALLTPGYETPEDVLRDADIAMYRAKSQGKARSAVFEPVMHARVLATLELEASLRHALETEAWVLHYQPIIDVRSGGVLGVEALLRWRHEDGRLVGPGEFIHIAEETGLIIPIGEWVLRHACAQVRAWRDQGLPDLYVSVNLSARQFHDPLLVETIRAALDTSGLAPHALHLELTESSLIDDVEAALVALHTLKGLGVHLSIDDFGIGYSSLNYLQRFPMTTIKIDRSFVRDVITKPSDAGIVTAIIAMAHRLDLGVVAEGVETAEQVAFLRSYNCDAVQGFLFCPPQAPDDFFQCVNDQRGKWMAHTESDAAPA
jgi:diguanylate cyclase (GGDEF)-like protein